MNTKEDQPPQLQIVILSGPAHPERAVLGLAAALSAVHTDVTVRVVFAMKGAIWCAPTEGNGVLVPRYPPIGDMIEALLEEGGEVLGCASCVDQYCPAPPAEDGAKQLREGIGRIGLSVVTLHMLEGQTVTF